ncbi:MAG: ATP-grasp domain-containing protein [Planctomycetes bacterium]|nr:ATP-grasp domain-containing protein [Planctomycetota bacterium]
MPRVVFVAPFAADTTMRFTRCTAALPGVQLGLITQEPLEKFPDEIRRQLGAYRRVGDAMVTDELERATRSIGDEWGGKPERLIGVLEQLQVPLAEVRERLSIRGMDAAEARNFRDKSRMKDVLRANGLPCAQHRLCPTASEALEFAARVGYPLVVKPPAGAGARNTFRVDDRGQLEGYLRTQPPSDGAPVLLEEFITGEEFSFDTVTLHGKHLFHSINVYAPSPLDVLQNPWIQWCVMLPRRIDTPQFAPIFDAGPRALDALGIHTGVTHMEWFRRPDGRIAISEVAARPPGAQFSSLISYAHDFDLYTAWARLLVFEEFAKPERVYSAGAAYLRGLGQGRVLGIDGLEQVQREFGSIIVEAKLPQVGQSTSGTYEGEGFIIVRHPETEVVEHALRQIVSTLRVRLG